jgi:hypothetical protein
VSLRFARGSPAVQDWNMAHIKYFVIAHNEFILKGFFNVNLGSIRKITYQMLNAIFDVMI